MAKVKATIDRFEGDKGVLVFADGQQLVVARQDLDGDLQEGDVVYLDFRLDRAATINQEQLARTILREILNNNAAT